MRYLVFNLFILLNKISKDKIDKKRWCNHIVGELQKLDYLLWLFGAKKSEVYKIIKENWCFITGAFSLLYTNFKLSMNAVT